MQPKELFLQAVLGEEGAEALRKAVSVYTEAESVLLSRAILSWLEVCPDNSSVPGLPDSCFRLEKKENDTYFGYVDVNGFEIPFAKQPLSVAAAYVSVALGVVPSQEEAAAVPLARLGKSVDLLVKARLLANLRKKVLDPNSGYKFSHEVHTGSLPGITVFAHDQQGAKIGYARLNHSGPHLEPMGVYVEDEHQRKGLASTMYSMAEKHTGKKIVPNPKAQTAEGAALWAGKSNMQQFGKSEDSTTAPDGHSKFAASLEPEKPRNFLTPNSQEKPKLPKLKKSVLQVSGAQLRKSCGFCAHPNIEDSSFVGCLCFRGIASEVNVRKSGDSYFLTLGSSWDKDTVITFLEGLN